MKNPSNHTHKQKHSTEIMQTSIINKPKLNVSDITILAKKYNKQLIYFAMRRGAPSEQDAQDIVQSAYIEAIRCAANFLGNAAPKTWLMGIVVNLTRNNLSKAYRKYETSNNLYLDKDDNEDSFEKEDIEFSTPQNIHELNEYFGNIDNIFSQMSVEMRNTAELVLIDELSYEQAAQAMHIPIGTVRSRVSRARSMLKLIQEKQAA
jgi:RNA polymerase sigma factor (sigma-70 family)